jgi:adenine deaminase
MIAPYPPSFSVAANVVDIPNRRTYPAVVDVVAGRIARITHDSNTAHHTFLLPGFVDAHIHVESSMLPPAEFARLAAPRGTVATVSDPHEIANVLGVAGVRYMIDDARGVPFHFCFGAPSCVPATAFETAGATLDAAAVEQLLRDPAVGYLSEVMNVPGVLNGDPDLLAKIAAARRLNKPVDGHAPNLRGRDAQAYFAAGISTDHESVTYDEAHEKIGYGAHILIREGSAARNFDALRRLIDERPDRVMLCSDDKHPNDLVEHGHVDALVRRAVENGVDVMNVLRAACVNPVHHYRLPTGLLRVGDRADFIEVADLRSFHVLRTWVNGQLVARDGRSLIERSEPKILNRFVAREKHAEDFVVRAGDANAPRSTIGVTDGQLVTRHLRERAATVDDRAVPDPARDVLKVTVVNRYAPDAPPAVAFIKGFGLRRGAIASSVAHDSHNVVAVGTTDQDLCRAVNEIVRHRGGLTVVDGGRTDTLPLPIAGLMSDLDGHEVARRYADLDRRAKHLGSSLAAPFMTLSFMALLVIPELKISDRGLFDGVAWRFQDAST